MTLQSRRDKRGEELQSFRKEHQEINKEKPLVNVLLLLMGCGAPRAQESPHYHHYDGEGSNCDDDDNDKDVILTTSRTWFTSRGEKLD